MHKFHKLLTITISLLLVLILQSTCFAEYTEVPFTPDNTHYGVQGLVEVITLGYPDSNTYCSHMVPNGVGKYNLTIESDKPSLRGKYWVQIVPTENLNLYRNVENTWLFTYKVNGNVEGICWAGKYWK